MAHIQSQFVDVLGHTIKMAQKKELLILNKRDAQKYYLNCYKNKQYSNSISNALLLSENCLLSIWSYRNDLNRYFEFIFQKLNVVHKTDREA